MFPSINDWLSKVLGHKESDASSIENNVLAAARVLGISEFEVFKASYQHWFGTSSDAIAIESCFTAYIFEGEIPYWTRHFCHRVMTMHQQGQLDPSQFWSGKPAQSDYLVINTLVA